MPSFAHKLSHRPCRILVSRDVLPAQDGPATTMSCFIRYTFCNSPHINETGMIGRALPGVQRKY